MPIKLPVKNLLLAITGSSTAACIPEYILDLKEKVAENVNVIVSHSARRFVTPYALRVYSGNYVFVDSFDISPEITIPHLELTRKSDLFLVMPATANIIGKAANGICDDLISTAILGSRIPVIFVPSMNADMWNSKALQRNLKILNELGHGVIYEPVPGVSSLVDMKTGEETPKETPTVPDIDILVEKIKKLE